MNTGMDYQQLLSASLQTLQMIGLSTVISLILGVPLGVLLELSKKGGVWERPLLYRVLDFIVNVFRSFPFIILIVILMPLARLLIGQSTGTNGAIVSLSIAAAPFVARIIEQSLNEVDPGVIEASRAMGSSNFYMICHVFLPEALPSLINGITITIINIVGYSAMAGAVGGGGLGDLALRFGLYSKNPKMLWSAVLILLILVQLIQILGNRLSLGLDRRRSFSGR